MRSTISGSTRKCWPNLFRGTCRSVATLVLRRPPYLGPRHLHCRFNGLDKAVGLRPTGPGDVGCRAVIDRGTDDRQAESDIDPLAKARVPEHRQALIVVHRERAIGAREALRDEKSIRRQGTCEAHSFPLQLLDNRPDHVDFLPPEIAALPCVRIESCDENPRGSDAETAAELRAENANGALQTFAGELA